MTTKKLHPLLLLAATTLIAAPLLLVSCTGTDDSDTQQPSTQQADLQPINFGAYLNRVTTRGGAVGALDASALQTNGFGVFAYYTDDAPYSLTAHPNFMYNQKVTYVSSNWTYSPVKYWPNETGPDAQSIGIDRLSFFAYAPYTNVDANIGYALDNSEPPVVSNTNGITALTRAIETGYPYVRYCVSTKPSECVDLCWADPKAYPDSDPSKDIKGTINLTKPDIVDKVKFNFKHALAALNVQIDADIDDGKELTDVDDGDNTRIYVRSITFTGFATKGELNLYNGAWNNIECDCDVTSDPITIHDGRWDGYEGMSASLNEKPTGLNPVIVQSGTPTAGVTKTAVNLFDPTGATGTAEEAPIYVIPTNVPIRVTIVYDVETLDDKLVNNYLGDGVTHGSSIQNTITAYVKDGSGDNLKMEKGKQYTINLHLGMKSVQVSATVANWDGSYSANVDVPQN